MHVAERCQLAGLTDRLAQAPESRYESADRYTLCRTPGRADYVFGNYLILHDPPAPAALGDWLGLAAAKVWRGAPGRPAVVQWEQPERYPQSAAVTEHLVFACESAVPEGWSAPGGVVGVSSEAEWAELARFAAEQTATDQGWTQWRYGQYRALPATNRQWLCAVQDGRIVASGGIVSEAGLARFQEVITAADRRRQGLATALCTELMKRVQRPGRLVVAVADPATGADRMYRSLGLEQVGYQYTAIAAVGERNG